MGKKVLIVDDEQSIRKMLQTAFKKAGYETVLAADGEEALSILEDTPVHVMFIDLKLPGMNGIELCRAVKKLNPIVCPFAMTGYGSIFELAECRDAGFEDYFLKPIDLAMFLDTTAAAFTRLERWKNR